MLSRRNTLHRWSLCLALLLTALVVAQVQAGQFARNWGFGRGPGYHAGAGYNPVGFGFGGYAYGGYPDYGYYGYLPSAYAGTNQYGVPGRAGFDFSPAAAAVYPGMSGLMLGNPEAKPFLPRPELAPHGPPVEFETYEGAPTEVLPVQPQVPVEVLPPSNRVPSAPMTPSGPSLSPTLD